MFDDFALPVFRRYVTEEVGTYLASNMLAIPERMRSYVYRRTRSINLRLPLDSVKFDIQTRVLPNVSMFAINYRDPKEGCYV